MLQLFTINQTEVSNLLLTDEVDAGNHFSEAKHQYTVTSLNGRVR